MPLQKQNISISFSQGLDTKSDPNQVVPGKFLALENAVFGEGMSLNKRFGYQSLTGSTIAATSGFGLATYQNELITFDNKNLLSYNPENQTNLNKGPITGMEVDATAVYRSTNSQSSPDSAYNDSGRAYLYTWTDSLFNTSYKIVSADTGVQITQGNLPSNYISPNAFSVGNNLILTAIDNSTSPYSLVYFFFPISTNILNGPVVLANTVDTTASLYDGTVADGNLCLAWNASDVGVRTTLVNSQLVQVSTTIQPGEVASLSITVFSNKSSGTHYFWIAYYDSTYIKYFIQSTNDLTLVLAVTSVTVQAALTLIGYAIDSDGFLYFQANRTYSYSSVRTDTVSYVSISLSGVVGTPGTFLRGISLFSKCFVYNDTGFFVVAYGPPNGQGFEPTYFVVEAVNGTTPVTVGRLASTNGGGYATNMTSVNQITPSIFQFTYLFKDLLIASNTAPNNVYTQLGVNSATLDFESINNFQTATLGDTLIINGGLGWLYDGQTVAEQGFNLFPEDMAATSASSGAGLFNNVYGYIATYEWIDNQGNTHRSAPSPVSSVMISTSSSFAAVTVQIPTLRLTQKQNVSVVVYRNAPSVSVGTFYRISPIQAPIASTGTIDSVSFVDTQTDNQIIGNELLYTTGGVVENAPMPAVVSLNVYSNRIMAINAEDRNILTYSQQVFQSSPVEFSDALTLFVDPRFGEMTSLAVMDDKEILFKENASFYMTGQGPDATGLSNDFSEPVFINSSVGCTNPKSLALMPDGIMFQSNKGIWLLDRGLGVSYIGADVEAFNKAVITSALLIPGTTQVRFTLDSGIALVYDYFYKIWGTFTNQNAIAAVNFQGLHTYLNPGSYPRLYQENPGNYSDDTRPILMKVVTSWLSASGLQGYQRIYQLYIMAQYKTPHVLNVSVAYDFNTGITQTARILQTQNPAYGGNPYYGASDKYGGIPSLEQYRVNLVRQKCQSLQVTLAESMDTSNYVLGGGLTIENIGFLVGQKLTYPKLPPGKSVT